MTAVTPEASNDLRSRIVAVLCEDRDVRNIGALADQLEAAIRSAEPVAWLRHGEETPVQNVPFGAMWISDKDDPRSFPVYDCPQQPAPSVAVKALDDLVLPIAGTLFVARGAASARSYQEIVPHGDGYFYLVKIEDVAKALEPFRSALSAQVQDVADMPQSPWPASDWAIGRIKELEAQAIPEGWQLVPKKPTKAMAYAAACTHYGKRRVDQTGIEGISMTVNNIDYNFSTAFLKFWKGALAAAPSKQEGGG